MANVPLFRFWGPRTIKNHSFLCQGSTAGKEFWVEVSVHGEHLPKPLFWKPPFVVGSTQLQDEIWEFQFLSGTSGGKGGLHVISVTHFVFVVLLAMTNLLRNLNLGCLGGFTIEISHSAGVHSEADRDPDLSPELSQDLSGTMSRTELFSKKFSRS